MNGKQERSYAKESTKSTPSGIRFDLEKLAFIQKRENVPTKQKVVDFLLNKYWWENKLPHVTAKEVPPMELKAGFQDLTKPTNEIKPYEQPKTNYEVKMPPNKEMLPIGDYSVLHGEILKTTTIKEIQEVMAKVKSALLNGKQKQALEATAKEHSKDFFND